MATTKGKKSAEKASMERLQQRTNRYKKREKRQREVVTRQELFSDLSFMFMILLAFIIMYYVNKGTLDAVMANPERPLLLRVFILCLFQFGMAGLGPLYVIFHRYESLEEHGLGKQNILPALGLSAVCFLPMLLVRILRGGLSYQIFKYVPLMEEIEKAGSPNSELGMAIVFLVFGLVQGFAYLVLADRVDRWGPFKIRNPWISVGGILAGILLVVVSSVSSGMLPGWPERIAAFVMMYGLVLVHKRTGNAVGTVAVFLLLWNMI